MRRWLFVPNDSLLQAPASHLKRGTLWSWYIHVWNRQWKGRQTHIYMENTQVPHCLIYLLIIGFTPMQSFADFSILVFFFISHLLYRYLNSDSVLSLNSPLGFHFFCRYFNILFNKRPFSILNLNYYHFLSTLDSRMDDPVFFNTFFPLLSSLILYINNF